MLEVDRIGPSYSEPVIEGDETLPLMASWWLKPSVVWQAVWPDHRICVEFSIDRLDGSITRFSVVNAPAVDVRETSFAVDETEGMPIVDPSPFDSDPDLSPQTDLVKFHCAPTAVACRGYVEIRLSDTSPVQWAVSGQVGFGIDASSRLVAIRVLSSILDPASVLSGY